MTGTDLVAAAADELYGTDPDEFTQRRAALVAQARAAGQQPAAKQIGALRKPNRSAWVLNQLGRGDASVGQRLTELGNELRAAQASLDGARMRELSVRRRELIDALVQQAFAAAGQQAPAAALRDEVTATLGAALADPDLAGRLQAGTLVRAARPEGFATGPVLTLLPSPPQAPGGSAAPDVTAAPGTAGGPGLPGAPGGTGARAGGQAGAPAPRRPSRAEAAAARAQAERERREAAIARAEQRLAEADQAYAAASQAQREQEDQAGQLEAQLATVRQQLRQTSLAASRAKAAQRAARQTLTRLRGE